jgi:hypothetical protein
MSVDGTRDAIIAKINNIPFVNQDDYKNLISFIHSSFDKLNDYLTD